MDPQVPVANPSPPVVPAEPQVVASNTNGSSRKKILKIFLIIFGIILFLFVGVSGAAAAITYGALDISNPGVKKTVSMAVLSLPFTPKTPEYVLQSAILAQTKVSKHTFNVSLAAESKDFVSSLGFSQLDVEAKGFVDYSDPNNLRTSLNASVTKDFNADLIKDGSMIFVKINKFPSIIATFAQLDPKKLSAVTENWIGIDNKPLQTEARKSLDEESPDESLTKEYIQDTVGDLLDEKLLPNLKLTEEKLDSKDVYKVHLVADAKTIDELIYKIEERTSGSSRNELRLNENYSKPSETISNMNFDLLIDKKNYYVRKIVTSFNIKPESPNTISNPTKVLGVSKILPKGDVLGLESSLYGVSQSETSISAVALFDKFGEDQEIKKPVKYLSFEEFYKKLMEEAGSEDLVKRSRDAVRLTDLATLQNAINVAVQEATSSAVLCEGVSNPCSGLSLGDNTASDGTGWVKMNLKNQKAVAVPLLPEDPINNSIYHYSYCAEGGSWEINTVLESEQQSSKMGTDGGDDPNKYEVGSNLDLINKTSGCRY